MQTIELPSAPVESSDKDQSYNFLVFFGRAKPEYNSSEAFLALLSRIESISEDGKWEMWTSHQGKTKHFTQFFCGHTYQSIKNHWHSDYNVLIANKHNGVESRFFLDHVNRLAILNDGLSQEIIPDAGNFLHRKDSSELFDDVDLTDVQKSLIIDNRCKFTICGQHHDDGANTLWVYCNSYSEMHLVDLTSTVGQIVLVGKSTHLRDENFQINYKIANTKKIIHFPESSLWKMCFSKEGKFSFKKWKNHKNPVDEDRSEELNKKRFYVPSIILPV